MTRELIIPVLIDHDQSRAIGVVKTKGGELCVKFCKDARIDRDEFFDIFGNVGVIIKDQFMEEGVMYITEARIVEFSVCGLCK